MADSPVKAWLARQAYTLVLRLGTPLYLWRVWSRGREEPDYRAHWPERLGFYRGSAGLEGSRHPHGGRVWVHAVSLGEARAAAPLIAALRAQRPGLRLLLTHTTATGREAGRALLQPGDAQSWLPCDTPGAVRRFLRHFQPSVGVLMETEVWPNLLHEARLAQVPMVLANARLSAKSLRQGQRFAALLRPAAQALSLTLAQTQCDADRLRSMGADPVQVCGNLKFDMTPSPELLTLGRRWRGADARPLCLAASTREGEEAGLLEAWLAAPKASPIPRPRLLIVPRHPQRFDEVAALVAQRGLSLSRRSSWPDHQPDAVALGADVWLGDSMGEMPAYYAAATVAWLGGSFAPLGGQNLIEAAACGCPLILGPSTYNFSEAAELSLAAGASRRVADWPEAVHASQVWLAEGASSAQSAARAFARQHQGASKRMSVDILRFVYAP
ncbi:3-deoxy-D-manno-octulosonic-acid transferase [Aquabacterium commune]|uniref:3-deoxy-D-manno-octulosonic acid transferase n=1 Tax=Aquabacterium commune TaxID=70586 RepID=A0A4R6RN19_9BURK|nr:3-deoxy-D-manno-octulosonic acid transferase [Aquabacterium commune]TDP88099.1 3-deoxy-D-manno-octulosonic-acid transferase [Aquabacterium commune]